MPLPVPNLDDRRFDDLVAEARERLASHLPELTQLVPGDPVHGFIDLFAWLTETILYRANLIPERQRRALLNLLQVPLRPARPAAGIVCVDAGSRTASLPALLAAGAQLKGGGQTFTTEGEVQPTPVELYVAIKEAVDDDTLARLGFTPEDLHDQHGLKEGERPQAFQPRHFQAGADPLSLSGSLDKAYYLALTAPRGLHSHVGELREALAGITLNVGIAPADDQEGDVVSDIRPRVLAWDLISEDEEGEPRFLPLEVVEDSSGGGRRMGVARLRLPRNGALFSSLAQDDPMNAGLGRLPPELPANVAPEHVVLWLRLRCPEEPDLPLGYLGVNGVEVRGQGLKRGLLVHVGTGQPDQLVDLPDTDIEPGSIQLDVEEEGAWVRWRPVDILAGHRADARVYRLDAAAGQIRFGDGISGRRPAARRRVRVVSYRHGGGTAGNLSAGLIKELSGGSERLRVRQEWPCSGGVDAEDVSQAERRIPQFLTHRNRAVTREDYRLLCLSNPVNPVARAVVREGFLPGASISAARENVPGVVTTFVLPPGRPALGRTPKPTQGLLKDVFSYLLDRVPIGTELYVLSPEFVPMAVGVRVEVLDPGTEQQTLAAVRSALVTYLWSLAPGGVEGQGWPLGGAVAANELLTQVARVQGVRAVNGLSLFALKSPATWRRLAPGEDLQLRSYQLPELLGVSAATGSGDPGLPDGVGYLDGTGPDGDGTDGRAVPAPVIPDLC